MRERQALEIFRLYSNEDLETALSRTKPVALAWDISNAQPGDWVLVRRLRHYPALSQAPFILYGHPPDSSKDVMQVQSGSLPQVGMTGFVVKTSITQTLLDAILAMGPTQDTGPILIVDDDSQVREAHHALVKDGLPGYPVQLAEDGEEALALMKKEVPSLVLLDLVMPKLSGGRDRPPGRLQGPGLLQPRVPQGDRNVSTSVSRRLLTSRHQLHLFKLPANKGNFLPGLGFIPLVCYR